MWDWLVRRVRVELALWDCYWWAWDHRDWDSFDYCEEHSYLVQLFWYGVYAAVMFVTVTALCGISDLCAGLMRRR